MLIKCTVTSIKRFLDLISHDKLKKIKIDLATDGFYYADYEVDLEIPCQVTLNNRVTATNILIDFNEMLLIDGIISFYLYYDLITGNPVLNFSYSKPITSADRILKLKMFTDSLLKVKELALDLGIDDAKIKNLYEKSLRQQGVRQQQGATKGTRFDEVSLGYSLDRIIESVK